MEENATSYFLTDVSVTTEDYDAYSSATGLVDGPSDSPITMSPVGAVTTAKNDGPITWDDATWILTSSFIIFTMQSGFGLLEAGVVSGKNEVNIMVKNAVDVIFGGITYWMFGFGLSFGEDPHWSNPFCGVGYFFVDIEDVNDGMGLLYANYIFQLSFATTATTIVSGAMAERTKLTAYIIFSFFNTITYCVPAHWVWGNGGWLKELKCIDIAGSGAVHLLGGVSALVAAVMLKPRTGRYDNGNKAPSLGNATNCLVGMFMLWWGWLGFNCGSTFGISGGKWKLAAKSAVTTINASMAGGAVGIIYSYVVNKRKYCIPDLVNSVLGGLVAITASCAVVRPHEAIVIGIIGALLGCLGTRFLDSLRIDDPVGASALHGFCGLWGMLAVGFFVDIDPLEDTTGGQRGLFHDGGLRLLGVQALACVAIIAWSASTTFIILFAIDKTIGLRLSLEDERLGTDYVEHGIGSETDLYFFENRPMHSGADTDKESVNHHTVSVRRRSKGALGFQRTVTFQSRHLCGGSGDVTITQDPVEKSQQNSTKVNIQGKINPAFTGEDGASSPN